MLRHSGMLAYIRSLGFYNEVRRIALQAKKANS